METALLALAVIVVFLLIVVGALVLGIYEFTVCGGDDT